MAHRCFDRPVSDYMTRDVAVASVETPIADLARTMHERGISGVPILRGGELVGVVTRTDLIQLGAMQPGRRWAAPALALPQGRAGDVMTREPRVVALDAPLCDAARIMTEHGLHRVFAVEGGRLAGVLSTLDLAAAVRDARIEAPLSSVMTALVLSIDVHSPVSAAFELLARVSVSGLIVTDAGLPVGMFTQLDALASRDLPRSTPVETTYDAAVICLPAETKLHRAAAHAAQLDVRRVVVCRGREAVGVIGGLDFARVAATS
ncbi:MAG TPA: CBS domain-containing protein [Kofleriaceae bacterium]|nr:CBS domain-containing protein [Kofleriaceae bacterium]